MTDKTKIRYISTNKGDIDKDVVIERPQPVQRVKKGVAYLLMLAIITCSLLYILSVLTSKKAPSYENALQELPARNLNNRKLKKYINYIVDKVKIRGIKAIKLKWSHPQPPGTQKQSEQKVELLGAVGFKVAGIYMARKGVYTVKCISNPPDNSVVFFDITKETLPSGERVYRLQKIY